MPGTGVCARDRGVQRTGCVQETSLMERKRPLEQRPEPRKQQTRQWGVTEGFKDLTLAWDPNHPSKNKKSSSAT